MILHKVSLSPYSHQSLFHCLASLSTGDGIILLQDAVYAATYQPFISQLAHMDCPIYLLSEDCQARQITPATTRLQQINYNDFVALTLAFDKVQSW